MKAALYLRVSTADQSLENQLPSIRQYCEARGFTITHIFTESDTAWKQGHQVELEKCKAAAQRREFDVLVLWALDRLTRQGPEAMLAMVRLFKAYSVRVLSVQEGWLETLDEMTMPFFLSIVGWLGMIDSARRSERIRAGRERVKATGKTKSGRPWGRQKGRKDGPDVKRRKSSYYLAWEGRKEAMNNLPQNVKRGDTQSLNVAAGDG